MADFYPTRLADRIPWHANFATRATATGLTLGLIAAEITQIGVDSQVLSETINRQEEVDSFAQSMTEYKNSVLEGNPLEPMPALPGLSVAPAQPEGALPGIEARTREFAARIKASAGYTQEIGELYGIVAPITPPAGVPELTATALTASQVQLAVAKAGYAVLAIDSRRGGGAWEQIGVSMTAEYIDARAPLTPGQPEQREYRCQGMQDNARVGALSAAVSAVTVP